jgi:hypothetical protein
MRTSVISSVKWMLNCTDCSDNLPIHAFMRRSVKKLTLLLFLLFSLRSAAQEYKDTIFSAREYTCTCKYNLNPEDDNGIFDMNAKEAHYPGGPDEWKKFVKKNMYKGFKGRHPVELKFTVDKNGNLSGFTVLNSAPAQKYEEVVRILKLSGKWFPSVQKGYCVQSVVHLQLEL